jgi:hypothetical protein
MVEPVRTKLRLKISRDEAAKAILDGLPEDAIVKDEDDAIGRFAADRVLVIVSRGHRRLMMFHGSWGSMKRRLDEPHLDVTIEDGAKGAIVSLAREAEKAPTLFSRLSDFVGQAVTIGAIAVAYYWFRSMEIDKQTVAIAAGGGAVLWSAVAHFSPKKKESGLYDYVRSSLKPHRIKKKKKKKNAAAAEEASDENPADEVGERDEAEPTLGVEDSAASDEGLILEASGDNPVVADSSDELRPDDD